MEPDTMRRLEAAVEELAAREYPQVWIGEEGMMELIRLGGHLKAVG